ncbi:MAG: RHS repeat-associated core domain-containing protein [Ktedonobacteraceae bacterium]
MVYNDGGELASLTYPNGQTVTTNYDVNGRAQSVYFGTPSSPDPVNFLVGQVNYTNDGQLVGLALGGSGPKAITPTNTLFSTAENYDSIHRLLSESATMTGQNQPFFSQTRVYDAIGNVIQLLTTIPTSGGGTKTDNQSYCYDDLSRLVWNGNNGTPTGGDDCGPSPTGTSIAYHHQAYSYDDLDRMTSGREGTDTYGDTSSVHAVTNLSDVPNQYATYDAMGNMTCQNTDTTSAHTCSGSSPTGATMSYDSRGQMVSWTAPSGTTASDTFLYDDEGNRVLQSASSTVNGTTTVTDTITFDGYTESTITGGTTTTLNYYSLGGQRLAVQQGTSPLIYLISDLLGSVDVAVNAGGTISAVQLYWPYGAGEYGWGTMPTTYNYTGQRLDSVTGLLYYNARYYDPFSDRFTTADTVQSNANGMDPYAYVIDDPVGKTDPSGHGGWLFNLATGIAIAAVAVAIVGIAVGAAPIIVTVAAGVAIGYGTTVAVNYIQNGYRMPQSQQDWNRWGLEALGGEFVGGFSGLLSGPLTVPADAEETDIWGEEIANDNARMNTSLKTVAVQLAIAGVTIGTSVAIHVAEPLVVPTNISASQRLAYTRIYTSWTARTWSSDYIYYASPQQSGDDQWRTQDIYVHRGYAP